MKPEFGHVAVLMGGPSAERDVSLASGRAVAGGLRDAGFDVVDIDVTSRQFDVPTTVDAVFIALHGEFGEDGELQGLLNEKGIPYTGSGADASRCAFDKAITKQLFAERGIPTADSEILGDGKARTLELPVVVKPTRQGSSIGVHRVETAAQWEAAVTDAAAYGEVLVEEYVAGRELTVGIVGDEALPVVEIAAPDGDYNYHAKYTRGVTEYLVPAPIDAGIARRCREIGLDVYRALGCRGFGRVDMRLGERDRIAVLEMNTIPGFTETSLLPKAAAQAGIPFPDLCRRILESARTD